MSSFSLSKTLQTIHINYPPSLQDDTSDDTILLTDPSQILSSTEVLSILKPCSPTITQFGCCTEVWEVSCNPLSISPDDDWYRRYQVIRTFMPTNDGYDVQLDLKKCENPDVPEQFLVTLLWFVSHSHVSSQSMIAATFSLIQQIINSSEDVRTLGGRNKSYLFLVHILWRHLPRPFLSRTVLTRSIVPLVSNSRLRSVSVGAEGIKGQNRARHGCGWQ